MSNDDISDVQKHGVRNLYIGRSTRHVNVGHHVVRESRGSFLLFSSAEQRILQASVGCTGPEILLLACAAADPSH